MLPEVSRCRSGQQSSMLTEAYPAASIPLDFSASPTSSSSEPLMLQWKAFHDDQPGARAQRAAQQVSASAQRPAAGPAPGQISAAREEDSPGVGTESASARTHGRHGGGAVLKSLGGGRRQQRGRE